mmetsp:Transcript_29016/g.84090  ORF Transcript_29016/g.84090 Transcript_29016/m.84090 type:complete len:87 (+) Transcript_29016:284-544(+)
MKWVPFDPVSFKNTNITLIKGNSSIFMMRNNYEINVIIIFIGWSIGVAGKCCLIWQNTCLLQCHIKVVLLLNCCHRLSLCNFRCEQ